MTSRSRLIRTGVRYEIREDTAGKRLWRLRNGKPIANSGADRQPTDEACKRAIQRIKTNVAKAPVDPARPSAFHFGIVRSAQGFSVAVAGWEERSCNVQLAVLHDS